KYLCKLVRGDASLRGIDQEDEVKRFVDRKPGVLQQRVRRHGFLIPALRTAPAVGAPALAEMRVIAFAAVELALPLDLSQEPQATVVVGVHGAEFLEINLLGQNAGFLH